MVGKGKDVLEVYPLNMQVNALPDRRYFKTSRVFILLTLLSLSITFAIGTFVIFSATRLDVSVTSPSFVGMFSLHPQQKVLKPTPYKTTTMPAMQLMAERFLWDHVAYLHRIVNDRKYMETIVGGQTPISSFATEMAVVRPFRARMEPALRQAQAQGFIRDVHILEVQHVSGDLFKIILDTFDMPVPDPLAPICKSCTDNTLECLMCKKQNAYRHDRYEIYTRVGIKRPGAISVSNPIGAYFRTYNILYMNENPTYPQWDLPMAWRT